MNTNIARSLKIGAKVVAVPDRAETALAEQGSMAEVTLLKLEIYRKMSECEERRWSHGEIVKNCMSVETNHKASNICGL
ncbi:hypothetical protein KIN20_012468 [Parelaphostrongylus tenuis]|uniref:Uncharacterized protein n=1 Tax=Parelaphostrongylus tenuis TaxID=148309 RepID=A0AAD5MTD7_PARTN|nr:hypothetical protein KIN20_012468 [Parelaphostrongylus tenuis]